MPTSEEPLATWLASASREMEGEDGTQRTLEASVRLAVRNIDGAEAAGVTMVVRGRVEATAQQGPLAIACDRLEHELREGPCCAAIAEGADLYSPSVADDARWLRFGPRASSELGVGSALSMLLRTDGSWEGALTMWSSTKDAFSVQDRVEATALAAHVAIALSSVRRSDLLRGGLDSRSVVGQAMGIVMERYDITAPVAFALLTRLSSTHEIKLRQLAHQIVETRELPD